MSVQGMKIGRGMMMMMLIMMNDDHVRDE